MEGNNIEDPIGLKDESEKMALDYWFEYGKNWNAYSLCQVWFANFKVLKDFSLFLR